jgi:hypothetical protein
VVLVITAGASAQGGKVSNSQSLTASQRSALHWTDRRIQRFTRTAWHWDEVLGLPHRQFSYQPGDSQSIAYVQWVLGERMAVSRRLHQQAVRLMVKRTKVLLARAERLRLELGQRASVRQLADAQAVEARFNHARREVQALNSKWRNSGLLQALTCIHGYEGSWSSNTGNGYYGGLQADLMFQQQYGPDFLARWGTADKWPIWAQMAAAVRAIKGWDGPDPRTRKPRGFHPWPYTAHYCGLI